MNAKSDHETVKRMHQVFEAAGLGAKLRDLPDGARTPAEAARALGVEPGQVVKSQVFTVGNRYVLVLVAGDHKCREDQLPRVFNLDGAVVRPGADLVRAVTGFYRGAVAPLGLVSKLPVSIDASLKRFDAIYASAGHPSCVFETSVDELKKLTGGLVSYAVAGPA